MLALVAILSTPRRQEPRRVYYDGPSTRQPNPLYDPPRPPQSPPVANCERCNKPARRVWETSRSAIDIDLDHPVFLLVTVSVHRCPGCSRHFRAQPPFLRKNAVYAERVREKAVSSVYEDGMPFRRVTRGGSPGTSG